MELGVAKYAKVIRSNIKRLQVHHLEQREACACAY